MRLATWNVNSLRSRLDRVEAFLQRHDIDVLALQETKAREDQLPLMGLQALGYDIAVAGLASTLEKADGGTEQLVAVADAVAAAFGVGYVRLEVDRADGERDAAELGLLFVNPCKLVGFVCNAIGRAASGAIAVSRASDSRISRTCASNSAFAAAARPGSGGALPTRRGT